VTQEAFSRLASLDNVAHIGSGRAYLFQTTRNIVLEQVRRAKTIHIDNVTDIGTLSIVDEVPPLDRALFQEVSGTLAPAVLRTVEDLPSGVHEIPAELKHYNVAAPGSSSR
jgi:DNA-directed RNA polymerase specialized sigma24 family protein